MFHHLLKVERNPKCEHSKQEEITGYLVVRIRLNRNLRQKVGLRGTQVVPFHKFTNFSFVFFSTGFKSEEK